MRYRLTLALFAPFALSACYRITLTPEEEAVRVTANPDAVRNCRLVGPIAAEDNIDSGNRAEENAQRFLKRDAHKMGANAVLLIASTANGSKKRGEAYVCTV